MIFFLKSGGGTAPLVNEQLHPCYKTILKYSEYFITLINMCITNVHYKKHVFTILDKL